MHEKFLEHLTKCSDVYLLARLKDQRLGYNHPEDMGIFFPDLHLIGNDREKEFNYKTNEQELLKKVLEKVKEFKSDPNINTKRISVYQLGDFLDLWRQTPFYLQIAKFAKKAEEGVQKIQDDKKSIINLFKNAPIKTNFLLGNHDFDLHDFPEFSDSVLKYYLPFDLDNFNDLDDLFKKVTIVVLHGDIFSLLEKNVPDLLQQLAVFLLGPGKKPSVKALGELRKEMIKPFKNRKFTNFIQQRTPPVLDTLIKIEDNNLPIGDENFNVKKAGETTNDKNLRFLEDSKKFFAEANTNFGLSLKTAIVGHTHHPRIAIDERNDQFFAVVDCGAWITKIKAIKDGKEDVFDSAQIGVLHNNDVRIYQLFPKTNA